MVSDHQLISKVAKVKQLLRSIGLEVPEETYERFTKMLMGVTQERENIEDIKGGRFEERFEGVVVEKDIPIYSYYEHHILPWFGQVHIGYVAHNRVLGISKFTRIVNYYSFGVTIQERVTQDLANFFKKHMSKDVMVMIEAIHTCKVARGPQNPFSRSITIVAEGVFREDIGPRLEFFESVGSARKNL